MDVNVRTLSNASDNISYTGFGFFHELKGVYGKQYKGGLTRREQA